MVRFLSDKNYHEAILPTELEHLLDGRKTALASAENKALSQFKQYVGQVLDTKTIFSQTKDDRDSFIIMILIDLALYHVYTSAAPDQIPEHRTQRYDDATTWLKDVGRGKIKPQFPITVDPKDLNDTAIPVVSSLKKQNNFF